MAKRPTGGWNLEFDTDGLVGIIQEFEVSSEGDTQDVTGLGDIQGTIYRRKGVAVDVGETLSISGIIDEGAPGYENFRTAMLNRTQDVNLRFLKDGAGWQYTGMSESYNETASRSNGVWNFSCTFYVNESVEVVPS